MFIRVCSKFNLKEHVPVVSTGVYFKPLQIKTFDFGGWVGETYTDKNTDVKTAVRTTKLLLIGQHCLDFKAGQNAKHSSKEAKSKAVPLSRHCVCIW